MVGPRGVESRGLSQDFTHTDKDLPVQIQLRRVVTVVEGDHIGDAGVLEEVLVELGYLAAPDQVDAEPVTSESEVGEESLHNGPKRSEGDSRSAVRVGQEKCASLTGIRGGLHTPG